MTPPVQLFTVLPPCPLLHFYGLTYLYFITWPFVTTLLFIDYCKKLFACFISFSFSLYLPLPTHLQTIMHIRTLFWLLLTATLLYSCHTDKEDIPSIDNTGNYHTLTHPAAQRLAVVLQEEEIRTFVYSAIRERFDGDANILLADLLSRDLPASYQQRGMHTFADLLRDRPAGSSQRTGSTWPEALLQELPLYQLALPGLDAYDAKGWDEQHQIPRLAVVPPDVPLQALDYLHAWDHEGKHYRIDARTAPTEPVLVLSLNERTLAYASGTGPAPSPCEDDALDPIYSSSSVDYYDRQAVLLSSTTCTEGTGDPGESTENYYDRDSNGNYDQVHQVKFPNQKTLDNAESWFSGDVELDLYLVLGARDPQNFSISHTPFTVARRDLRECDGLFGSCETMTWATVDTRTIRWYNELYGRFIRYHMIEYDPIVYGKNQTYDADGRTIFDDGLETQAVLLVNITMNSEELGDTDVVYCDDTNGLGTYYDLGSIEIRVNQAQ